MTERLTVVDADGRRKAYRPLDAPTRATALASGIAAYERGDFFEAHELLEPAWMGTDDPAERAFVQGLIKLAAAYVHGVRGNPTGIGRNLVGAQTRLLEAIERGSDGAGLDLGALVADIDARRADLTAHPDEPTLGPPQLTRRTR